MDYKIKEGDTETWVLLFLYKVAPKSINDMATNGCKKMVFVQVSLNSNKYWIRWFKKN